MTDAARLSNEDLEYCLGEMTTGPVSRADVDIIRTHIVVIEGELEAERLRADAAEERAKALQRALVYFLKAEHDEPDEDGWVKYSESEFAIRFASELALLDPDARKEVVGE